MYAIASRAFRHRAAWSPAITTLLTAEARLPCSRNQAPSEKSQGSFETAHLQLSATPSQLSVVITHPPLFFVRENPPRPFAFALDTPI